MSRLGKLPIIIPAATDVTVNEGVITVKGPKGQLQQRIHPHVRMEVISGEQGKEVVVSVAQPDLKADRALWGLYRVLVQNMVTGVNTGFSKQLEINGVGYRAAAAGTKLTLNVGYSHPVDFLLPQGISASVEKNVITISGIDKHLVGETAARIRRIRKPEPYKGKGIKYVTEVIRRKAGKTAASK